MMQYKQIIAMCLAAMVACWGLALLWQADVTQGQCDSLLWVIFLPISFIINLTNIRAYRLSVIIHANMKRLKPFSHNKVLLWAVRFTLLTALVLLIASFVDPIRRVRVVVDIYRPSLDRYHCRAGIVTSALVYLVVLSHVMMSLICVVSVRNGMEAFKDGSVMKEAFVLLYMCVLVAFILGLLGISDTSLYVTRTACISIGVTVFCLRLLIGRCARHWVPNIIKNKYLVYYQKYIAPILGNMRIASTGNTIRVNNAFPKESSGRSAMHPRALSSIIPAEQQPQEESESGYQGRPRVNSSISFINHAEVQADSFLYVRDLPSDANLNEMFSVLTNPSRLPLFLSVARQNRCVDNVAFLLDVKRFKEESEPLIENAVKNIRESLGACEATNTRIREAAAQVSTSNMKSNSTFDSLLTLKKKEHVERVVNDWALEVSYPPGVKAMDSIRFDFQKRIGIFDGVSKEVSIQIYQNIWNKFRVAETERIAAGQELSVFGQGSSASAEVTLQDMN